MNTHPIIFSTPMVQAILEGRKTMTRRVLKPYPDEGSIPKKCTHLFDNERPLWGYTYCFNEKDLSEVTHIAVTCPYGQPGDVLWVRETFGKLLSFDKFVYKADCESKYDKPALGWKPSIHMPKSACRIWLEVTNIRVERLQDITKKDAISEGILSDHTDGDYYYFYPCNDLRDDTYLDNPITSFYSLWKSINGQESWNSNPFVWVIEFKRIDKPENF